MRAVIGNAAYLKLLRQEAVARGDCYMCRCRPAKDGCRTCQNCLDSGKARKHAARYVKCLRCNVRLSDATRQLCKECRKVQTKKALASSHRAQGLGLCGRCKHAPRVRNRASCISCLEELRQKAKKYKPVPKETRACSRCGANDHNSVFHTRIVPLQGTP